MGLIFSVKENYIDSVVTDILSDKQIKKLTNLYKRIYKTYLEMKAVSGRMTLKNTSLETSSSFCTSFSTSVRAYLNK